MKRHRRRLLNSATLTTVVAALPITQAHADGTGDSWAQLRASGDKGKALPAQRQAAAKVSHVLETRDYEYALSEQDFSDNLEALSAANAGDVANQRVKSSHSTGYGYAPSSAKWLPHVEFEGASGAGETYGQVDLFAPLWQSHDALLYANVIGSFADTPWENGSFGIGFRRILPGAALGQDAIFGGYGFLDVFNSPYGNTYYQATLGAELLTNNFEFRANAYLPDLSENTISSSDGTVVLSGSDIVFGGSDIVEQAMPGFDVEAGVKIDFSDAALRLNAGYFRFERDGDVIEGPKARAELEFNNAFGLDGAKLSFGGEIRNDDTNGTETVGFVRLRIPLGQKPQNSFAYAPELQGIDSQMTRRVHREMAITTNVVERTSAAGSGNVTDAISGETLQVLFVANTAQGAGDCSSVVNACDLGTATGLASTGDIFLAVDAAGPILGTFMLNADRQQVAGAGDTGSATLRLSDAGSNTLNVGGLGGRPVTAGVNIGNFADPTVFGIATNTATGLTGNGYTGTATFTDIEMTDGGINLSNSAAEAIFTDIDIQSGAATGVALTNLTGDTTLNNVDITSGTGGAVMLANNSGNITFDPDSTINHAAAATAIDIQNQTAGTVDIQGDITATTGATNAINVTNNTGGTINFGSGSATDPAILNIDTTSGTGINLVNNTGAAINFLDGFDIDTTTGTGFNATGGGTVHVNDPNGPTDADITSTGGTAININGVTSAGMEFSDIVSGGGTNNVLIDNLDGTGVFSWDSADLSNATGDGLVIQNSAATFDFTSAIPVVTTVTDAGGTGVLLDSNTGNVSFDVLNLVDPGDDGIDIQNAQANVTIGGGSYVQSQPGLPLGFAVQIANQAATSTISLTDFDITGTTADDFQPDLFNVTNAAGNITATGGTWQATNRNDIVDITGGTATINIGATIIQTGTSVANSNAVEIDSVTGGSITFDGPITQMGEGSAVDMDGNTGGTFTFNGLVSATGSSTDNAIDLTNNTGANIAFEGGLDITTSTGIGFNATGGGTVHVNDPNGPTDADVTSTGGTAININGITIANTGMEFSDIVSGGGTNNVLIDNLDGTGVFSWDSADLSNATGDGLVIQNSDATFSFTGGVPVVTAVTDAGGNGIFLDNNVGNVTFQEVDIDGSAGFGVAIQPDGGSVDIQGGTIGATATNQGGVSVDGGTGNVTVSAAITESSGAASAVDIQNRTGGTVDILGNIIAMTGAANAINVANNSGGTISFGTASVLDTEAVVNLDTTSGTGINLALNTGAEINFFDGFDIDTTTGIGFNATGGGTVHVNDPNGPIDADITSTGGTAININGITIANTGMEFSDIVSGGGTNNVLIDNLDGTGVFSWDSADLSNATGDGLVIQNSDATFSFTGGVPVVTAVTDAGGNGIFLSDNTGNITFQQVDITNPGADGLVIAGTQGGTLTFGDVTITDIGAAANQTGIQLSNATLGGAVNFNSVSISGPTTSTDSIGVDLTGLMGNQIVNLGSQVDPATGPSSSITGVHRGVVIDNTAAVQFTFGDGEATDDIGSVIDVNGQAGAFTVDIGGGTLAASSFNFEDVNFGAGDSANLPTVASTVTFVSTTGGLITAGTNGLSQNVTTVDVATAEAAANTGQTFVFVGDGAGSVDVNGGGADGFTLDLGQSIDGFNNGNVISFGSFQPMNVSGNLGATGGSLTANSAIVTNSTGAASAVITSAAAGNGTIENNILDGTGTVGSLVEITGATVAVTLNGLDLQNIGTGETGVNLAGNNAAISLMDVDLAGSNSGTALQVDVTGGPSTANVTVDGDSDIDGTTGTILQVGAGARDIDMSAVDITAANNTDNVIDITGQTGGTISFGTVDITGFNDATGTAINAQGTGGNLNFTEIDIAATNGDGLAVGGQTFTITNTTNTVSTTSGTALDFNGTNVNATFDNVSASALAGNTGVNLTNATGTLAVNGGTITTNSGAGSAIAIDGGSVAATFGGGNTIAYAGTGATVSVSGGHTGSLTYSGGINATNGTGLQFNNADGFQYNFNGVVTLDGSGAGADTGVDIVNGSDASFTFGTLSITNPTGTAFNYDNSTGGVVWTAGTLTQSNAASAIVFNNAQGGTRSINATIDADTTTANAIDINGSAGVFNFGGSLDIDTTSGTGVNFTGNTGTANFNGGLDIDTTTGTGINATGGGTLNVAATGGDESVTTTSGTAINANGVALGATFDNVSASALAGNTGVNLTNTTGTLAVNGGTITTNSGAGSAIAIDGGSVAATFGGGNTIAYAGTGATVSVSGGHTGSLIYSGGINATNGTGLQFNNADGTSYALNGVVTLNGGDAGVDIVNGSDASFTFSNLSITNPTGTAFNYDNSTGGVVWTAGTLTQSNAASAIVFNNALGGIRSINATIDADTTTANAIDINGSAGIFNFGGSLDIDTTSGTGVNFTGNTGTANFNGGLDIDTTTGTGFNATGGGTVTVQGTGNSVATGTGTAVNIANTTIGAADITFESVSANGGTNGIVLNNTGTSGGFTVTGVGTTPTSGGVIQNTTGDGISLTDTGPVSLNNMVITNIIGNGIDGTGVTDFELLGSSVTVLGISNAVNIELDTTVTPVTVNIQDNTFTTADGSGIFVRHLPAGTEIANVTIADNTVTGGGGVTQNGDGIFVRQDFEGTVNLLIDNNTVSGFGQTPIQVFAVNSVTGTGTVNATITNNTIGPEATGALDTGITVLASNANTLCANISGNDMTASTTAVDIDFQQVAGPSVINVTQSSSLDVTTSNNGATVNTFGTVNFNQPACTLP